MPVTNPFRIAAVSGCMMIASMITIPVTAQAQLAATPPMGWNSWNHFAEKVTDADVRASADIIVSSGMRDAGYIYVNIDDAWQGERDAQGILHPNSKFPDMKALAYYVHSKGLKIGIYSGPGPKTCGGYVGSYQHEEQDAKMWADWGFDYFKYDMCSMNRRDPEGVERRRRESTSSLRRPSYEKMHKALASDRTSDRLQPLPVRFSERVGSGDRLSAVTCGARPATSATTTTRMSEIGFMQQSSAG